MGGALAELQCELMDEVAPHGWVNGQASTDLVLDLVMEIVRRHGFEPVGCGSSRVAVWLEKGRTVAKVSHSYLGPTWNLQEAAAWLVMPDHVRRVMTPCVSLSPELIVTQKWGDVLGYPLHEQEAASGADLAFMREQGDQDLQMFAEELGEIRATFGLGPMTKGWRLDNYATVGEGDEFRVVKVDYATVWPPFWETWTWLLNATKDAPVRLRGGARLGDDLAPTSYSGAPPPLTLADLAGRAGATDPHAAVAARPDTSNADVLLMSAAQAAMNASQAPAD